MQRGINKVILLGNVGNDPEYKHLENNSEVCNIVVATSEVWKDKKGEEQERTEWHRVVFWNQLASLVYKYVNKGDKIYIEGKLQTRSYDKDGIKTYSTELIAKEVQFLGKNAKSSDENAKSSNENAKIETDQFDDDIPF